MPAPPDRACSRRMHERSPSAAWSSRCPTVDLTRTDVPSCSDIPGDQVVRSGPSADRARACSPRAGWRPLGSASADPLPIDARIVNDCVHAPDGVDLFGDAPCLDTAAKITNHNPGRACGKVGQRRCAIRRPCMQHDLVTVGDKGFRSSAAKSVGASGNEDASQFVFTRRS
jgi:hypothetical protein